MEKSNSAMQQRVGGGGGDVGGFRILPIVFDLSVLNAVFYDVHVFLLTSPPSLNAPSYLFNLLINFNLKINKNRVRA
jgi:hypothetical protein